MEIKKIAAGLFVVGSLTILTGCGKGSDDDSKSDSKTQILSCTKSEEEEGASLKQTINFTYNKSDKKFVSGDMAMEYSFDDEDMYALFSSLDLCDSFEDEDYKVFTDCESKKSDKSVNTTFKIDLDELEEQNDEDSTIQFKKSMSIDDLKKNMESDEYTCKIK